MGFKVCLFFQHMPPYSGAAALRGQSIVRALPALLPNAEIVVYTSTPKPHAIEGVDVVPLKVAEVENSQGLKQRILGELRLGYAAARQMFSVGRKADLAVISSPGYIAALVQVFFARWHRVPYVLEMRDIYPQVYAEALLLDRRSLLYKFFSRLSCWMYRHAELVLCATKGLAREVLRVEPEANVRHVYNGFPAALSDRRPDKYSRFTVCFHGILGFFQDVETLLQVSSRLAEHDIDVVVVGYGRKEALLQTAHLPNLRFLGRLPFEQTIAEIERCQLGLCLRLDDGISKDAFPVKVWEYLGLGIPSVVTPPCEAGDFLLEHDCGVVLNSGDVEGIVGAVLKAKHEPSYLQQLSSNCRSLAAQYTRERTGAAAAEAVITVLH